MWNNSARGLDIQFLYSTVKKPIEYTNIPDNFICAKIIAVEIFSSFSKPICFITWFSICLLLEIFEGPRWFSRITKKLHWIIKFWSPYHINDKVVVSNMFCDFYPNFGGDDPIWRAYLVQMGWFNHQLTINNNLPGRSWDVPFLP